MVKRKSCLEFSRAEMRKTEKESVVTDCTFLQILVIQDDSDLEIDVNLV